MATPDLDKRFTYHPPTPERRRLHEQVREGSFILAQVFDAVLPESREKALALTSLEEALMWANACIARRIT